MVPYSAFCGKLARACGVPAVGRSTAGNDVLATIESVTAEILLILSFCGVGWGVQSHFIVKPNLVLRLGWGFDNLLC